MSRPTPSSCKTGNRSAYNEALKRRGSLTIWFDPAMIQTCLTMKLLFGMALRQTTGFVESPDRG